MPPKTLPDAEEWRAAILASSLDCIITMDATGRVVEFNTAAEKVFGYTAAEAEGRELATLIIPERYRARHRAGLARHLATGETGAIGTRVEVEELRKDGTELPVELAIARLATEGPPLFTAFIHRDLTENTPIPGGSARQRGEVQAALREVLGCDHPAGQRKVPGVQLASAIEMIRCASKEQLLQIHPSAIFALRSSPTDALLLKRPTR